MEGRMTGYRSRLSYHPHPCNATIISDSSQYSEQCVLEDLHSGNNTRLGTWQLAPHPSDELIEFYALAIINWDPLQQSFLLSAELQRSIHGLTLAITAIDPFTSGINYTMQT